MKFKPASLLVLSLQKALHGISLWSGRQAMEPCCPLVVVTQADSRQAYRRLYNSAPSRAGDGAAVREFDLVLLLLDFNVLPCLFHLVPTKKPNIDTIVQIQKSIRLMQNCTFS